MATMVRACAPLSLSLSLSLAVVAGSRWFGIPLFYAPFAHAGVDVKIAVCGIKLHSEHEDVCVACVELVRCQLSMWHECFPAFTCLNEYVRRRIKKTRLRFLSS